MYIYMYVYLYIYIYIHIYMYICMYVSLRILPCEPPFLFVSFPVFTFSRVAELFIFSNLFNSPGPGINQGEGGG